jgi:hypothetical protein
MSKYTIIRDTRERVGYWDFPETSKCNGTLSSTLKTGDYSIQGYEDKFCIERKKTLHSEFVANITTKRWRNCLERMSEMEEPYIIFEFPERHVTEWPKCVFDSVNETIKEKNMSPWSAKKYRNTAERRIYRKDRSGNLLDIPYIGPKFIWSNIHALEDKFGIKYFFCENAYEAQKLALKLIEEYHEKTLL